MPTEFTPFTSLAGGVLIGLSAVLLMFAQGRVAGMTGIFAGVLPGSANREHLWRVVFLAGAIIAPFILTFGANVAVPFAVPVTTTMLVIGGVLVGIGVTFGGGCTSGHGVCGMARLSPRSIVATGTFMIATFITVFIVRHVVGLGG
ncbi:MAG: YeeE/YedE thiosulfate transporter family protein [Pseudomonadota bacterium]